MPSSNILLFDANKANMMADEQYSTNTQRLNGVQSGIASSQLQNKTLYQVSLVAYAIAQIMNQNGLDANDTAAVSAFVANLSGTMLQKVADLASTQEAQAGVATGKWMSPALVKTAIDTLAAKAQNILSSETKTAYGLGSDAVPDDVLALLSKAALYEGGKFETIEGSGISISSLTYVSGVYYGTGNNVQNNINLGFQPKAVFVVVSNYKAFVGSNDGQYLALTTRSSQTPGLALSSTGFIASNYNTSSVMAVVMNQSGFSYNYLAFK